MGILKSILPAAWYTTYLRVKNSVSPEKIPHDSPEVLKQREAFYRQFVSAGDLVYDVGANYGNRIIPFLGIGCQVVAVEPQARCSAYLEKTFGNQITLVRQGLSDKEEERTFYISNSSTISTFSGEWIDKVKEGRFRYHTWDRTETVSMTTLDKLIATLGRPRFIKIDVEGFELEVLKGLHQPVGLVSIEYNVPENLEKSIACLEHLDALAPGCRYNYSVGESMQLAMEDWKDLGNMIQIIRSDDFIRTSFGDIYIRSKVSETN